MSVMSRKHRELIEEMEDYEPTREEMEGGDEVLEALRHDDVIEISFYGLYTRDEEDFEKWRGEDGTMLHETAIKIHLQNAIVAGGHLHYGAMGYVSV